MLPPPRTQVSTTLPASLADRFAVVETRKADWLCDNWIVESDGKRVRLAVLRAELASASARIGRTALILQAWRASAALRHEAFMPVLDLGTVSTQGAVTAWATTEDLAAPTLTQLIDDRPLGPAVAASLLIQVVDALEAASPYGPHLGLAPHNLIVQLDPVLRVRLAGHGTLAALHRDIPGFAMHDSSRAAWLAPEQLSGRHSGAQTDMWQLGGLLRYALTGVTPSDPIEPRALTPSALALVRWLMHPDPLSRPDHYGVVREQFEALALGPVGEPPQVTPTLQLNREELDEEIEATQEVAAPSPLLRFAGPLAAAAFILASIALWMR